MLASAARRDAYKARSADEPAPYKSKLDAAVLGDGGEFCALITSTAAFEYRKMVVDSGCTATLTQTGVHRFLRNWQDSVMTIRGFSSDNLVFAERHGQLNTYIMSPRRHETGAEYKHKSVDSVDKLNEELFALPVAFEEDDFNIILLQDSDEFSGMYKTVHTADGTDVIQVPFDYDYDMHAWVIHYVVAADLATARKAGRDLESRLWRHTKHNARRAENATMSGLQLVRALTVAGGVVEMHDSNGNVDTFDTAALAAHTEAFNMQAEQHERVKRKFIAAFEAELTAEFPKITSARTQAHSAWLALGDDMKQDAYDNYMPSDDSDDGNDDSSDESDDEDGDTAAEALRSHADLKVDADVPHIRYICGHPDPAQEEYVAAACDEYMRSHKCLDKTEATAAALKQWDAREMFINKRVQQLHDEFPKLQPGKARAAAIGAYDAEAAYHNCEQVVNSVNKSGTMVDISLVDHPEMWELYGVTAATHYDDLDARVHDGQIDHCTHADGWNDVVDVTTVTTRAAPATTINDDGKEVILDGSEPEPQTDDHHPIPDDENQRPPADLAESSVDMDLSSSDGWTDVYDTKDVDNNIRNDVDEYVTSGTKNTIGSMTKKLTSLQYHSRSHVGHHPECIICKQVKAKLRRIYALKTPHKEVRPGHSWDGDLLTWSSRSREGSKYSFVLRDRCTGFFVLEHLFLKSDARQALESVVGRMRNSNLFKQDGYQVFSAVFLDPAGEWHHRTAEWKELSERLGLDVTYSDPVDKRSAAGAENAVLQIEKGTKTLMLTTRLATEMWQLAADQAAELRNLHPLTRNIVSSDGDAVRPIEQLTHGRISRQQCDRRLAMYVLVGTPCLVSIPHTKGSNVDDIARTKWGLVKKMLKDMPIFESPFNNAEFMSKNYISFDLPDGMSAYEFLGLPIPTLPKACFPHTGDSTERPDTIIQLDGIGHDIAGHRVAPTAPRVKSADDADPLVTVTDKTGRIYEPDDSGTLQPTTGLIQRLADAGVIPQVDDAEDDGAREGDLLQYTPSIFVGRDVFKHFDDHGVCHGIVVDTNFDRSSNTPIWGIKYDDGVKEDYNIDEMRRFCLDRVDGDTIKPNGDSPVPEQPAADMHSAADLFKDVPVYVTEDKQSFFDVCDAISLPEGQRRLYYDWIGLHFKLGHLHQQSNDGVGFVHPFGRAKSKPKFDAGVKFPLPQGQLWQQALDMHTAESNAKNQEHTNAHLATVAEDIIIDDEYLMTKLRRTLENDEHLCTLMCMNIIRETSGDEIARVASSGIDPDLIDPVTGKLTVPLNLAQAMKRSDWKQWEEALHKEQSALDDLGVISHNHRLSDLRARGFTQRPVPLKILPSVKYHPNGELDRRKIRCVLTGHSGYLIKGVHFDNVFAAAPNTSTGRIVQALCVGLNWKNVCWDITAAYCHSETRDTEKFPVRYPVGLRRTDPKTGEELYCLLERNLYGSPVGARRWMETLTSWIVTHFNSSEWSVRRTRADPCLFVFKRSTGHRALIVIHTDDCDCIAERTEDAALIAAAFNEQYGIKMVDESHMLGVNREKKVDKDGVRSVELTQPDFIQTLYDNFQEHVPTRLAKIPFPEHMVLSLSNHEGVPTAPSSAESKQVMELGYRSVVGSLLWLARNALPAISDGVSYLSRVMSQPSMEAWKAAMHMVSYCYYKRHTGVRYNSNGNASPIAFYDSSHRSDPHDRKAQHGHSLHMFGGPIVWFSKKHSHVGLSTSHDEYMAAAHCAKNVFWVRTLLKEMGFPELVEKPTPMLGDNNQAIMWSMEDKVTAGNKAIHTEYHFVKEKYEEGVIDPRQIHTTLNLADVFTKALPRQAIDRLVPALTGYADLPDMPPPRPT